MNEFLTALAFSRYKFFLHTSHNPFHVTYLFLYPFENGQKPLVLLCFQWV